MSVTGHTSTQLCRVSSCIVIKVVSTQKKYAPTSVSGVNMPKKYFKPPPSNDLPGFWNHLGSVLTWRLHQWTPLPSKGHHYHRSNQRRHPGENLMLPTARWLSRMLWKKFTLVIPKTSIKIVQCSNFRHPEKESGNLFCSLKVHLGDKLHNSPTIQIFSRSFLESLPLTKNPPHWNRLPREINDF